MAVQRQEDLVALKRAIAQMRPRIDKLLSGGEKRELLKLISRGMVGTINDLKAYLSRVEKMKSKRSEESTGKLVGKVIDADSRRALNRTKVKIQHTNIDIETDGSGTFVWETMVKGKQYVIDCTCTGYKPTGYTFKATQDDEQSIVVKMAPLQRHGSGGDGPGGKKGGPKGGH